MKKLGKLLALALAVVMLLPAAALAAEGDGPRLVLNHLNWDEGHFIEDEVLADANNCETNLMYYTPLREDAVIFYVQDGGKKTPVIPEGDGNLSVRKLRRDETKPDAKESEYYVRLTMKEFKDGTLTTEYEGRTLSFSVSAGLEELGYYSTPEAKLENQITSWAYSPLIKDNSIYLVSTAADETHGRHLVSVELSKDWPDNDNVTMEKVSDNVYKFSLKSADKVPYFHLRVDVTWQNVAFMGGDTYVERDRDFWACEWASLLVSDKDTYQYRQDNYGIYDTLKADLSNTLTLKAGESVTVNMAYTYFPEEEGKWIVRPARASVCQASDSALKLTSSENEENICKLTISSDTPGTYTIILDNSYYVGNIYGLTHANGTPYTEAEFQKWDEETPYVFDPDNNGKLMIFTDLENGIAVPFEEAFPGEKADYESWLEKDVFAPVTVTVESATPEKLAFTDVEEGVWYEAAVRFVTGKSYMNGASAAKFNPEGRIKGAEFAQILYNKDGKPAAAEGASFQGVAGQWYEPAMLWAAGKGIVTDTGDTAVAPEKELTREQIALMLYNYLDKPAGEADLSAFEDGGQVSSWAKAAMEWAVSAKVFGGSTRGGKQYLDPTGTASRAQVAQVLMNYFG